MARRGGSPIVELVTFDGRIEAQLQLPAGVAFTATNSGGGPTAITIPAGSYFPSALIAQVLAQLNALRTPATWTVALSTGAFGTGQTTINWTGTGTYAIAWTVAGTQLRDVLGFTGDLVAVTHGVPSVGTKQHRGLWIPDCPVNLAGDVPRAPIVTDAMPCVSARGDVTVLVGNALWRHVGVKYSAVLEAKVWEGAAVIPNASWETFWKDTHLGQGSIPWFLPGSKLQLFDHAGRKLGSDANAGAGVAGWVPTKGPFDLEVKKYGVAWSGMWVIEIPELVATG